MLGLGSSKPLIRANMTWIFVYEVYGDDIEEKNTVKRGVMKRFIGQGWSSSRSSFYSKYPFALKCVVISVFLL